MTTPTVPTPAAADLLGVHRRTLTSWTRGGRIRAAVPARGSQPSRYEIAELHRLVRESTEGHGPECPVHHQPFEGHECQCVACHCGPDFAAGGFLGSCARCLRPRVENGRVVR